MNIPDPTNNFRKAYRAFSKNNKAQENIQELNQALTPYFGKDNFTATNYILPCCNHDLPGYLISHGNKKAFFPNKAALNYENKFIDTWGGYFNEAEFSFPPYISFGAIGDFVLQIKSCQSDIDKVIIGNKALSTLFPPNALASLAINLYPKFTALSDIHMQIRESIESYCVGHYRSAITTIIPCIENAIRELGKRHGLNEPQNVGTVFLLKIIDKSILFYINNSIFKDIDWYPKGIANEEFFCKFEERIQMMRNFRNYIENHLYQNSTNYNGKTNLNRHSIVHGFTSTYNYPENFLRLINALNCVCFMLTFSGEPVSLFFPEDTVESLKLSFLLSVLERMGIQKAMLADKLGLVM
ncbi:hypothetical protein [Pseudescherichia vulneris]|uniref:hypothetical protein n=1 Tax=Pseudescherichia vulneris TaxID=566 RepID=UPI0028D6F18B|nr:hypothetical protein [Pseudescherichia vulneris]